jgi:hypothetical protein
MNNKLLQYIYKILFNKKKVEINSKLNDILFFEKDIEDIKILLNNFERKLTEYFFNEKLTDNKVNQLKIQLSDLYNNNKTNIKNNIHLTTKFIILLDLINFKNYEFDKELLNLYSNIDILINEYDDLILNLDDILYLNDNKFDTKLSKLNLNDSIKSKLKTLKQKCDILITTFNELRTKCINSNNPNIYKDKINFLLEIMGNNKFL